MKKIIVLLIIFFLMNCASQKVPSWSINTPIYKDNFLFISGGYFESASSSKTSEELSRTSAHQRALHKAMGNKIWPDIKSLIERFISFHLPLESSAHEIINDRIKIKIQNYDVKRIPFKEKKYEYFEAEKKYYTLIFIAFKDIDGIIQKIIIRECLEYISENNLTIDSIYLKEKLNSEFKISHKTNNF